MNNRMGSRPQFDYVNPALALRMQQVATSITVATDAIGLACQDTMEWPG